MKTFHVTSLSTTTKMVLIKMMVILLMITITTMMVMEIIEILQSLKPYIQNHSYGLIQTDDKSAIVHLSS